jgi:hypothetical protein
MICKQMETKQNSLSLPKRIEMVFEQNLNNNVWYTLLGL